jgi:Flp pilus assembly protein TadD
VIKRFYAPYLAEKGELDRAMDFYEDCLDVAPTDVPLLLEYANTLQKAGRDFEIPKILRDVLQTNPDPNTRAQTLAWLIELEQPKRVESVVSAEKKMGEGDFAGAVRDLKPLRNWLADYWKLWAMLSAAHNRLGEAEEAEQAAKKLLELFPGCEPGYGELVSALSAQDRNDEAYQIMRFAAMNMPGALGVHVNLALAAKRAGHADEARSLARQIREAVGPNEELEPVLAEIEA